MRGNFHLFVVTCHLQSFCVFFSSWCLPLLRCAVDEGFVNFRCLSIVLHVAVVKSRCWPVLMLASFVVLLSVSC